MLLNRFEQSVTETQRRQPGCGACRMQLDSHHRRL